MAYRSAPMTDSLIWRTPLFEREPGLADVLRGNIAKQRPHLLDFIGLDEPPPPQAMTLAQWSRRSELTSLLARYSDYIYRNNPAQERENKPLLSLWAQWYTGLLVPPLMLALLTEDRALTLSPQHFHVEFHETGRAAKFWIDVQPDAELTRYASLKRMECLVTQTLVPIVGALEATGEINSKLIWSNIGYLIHWYLNDMRTLPGEDRVNAVRQHLFFTQRFADGQDNPLWRTVVMRDGVLARRTCCQRYRLPDVQQCGDCTLK